MTSTAFGNRAAQRGKQRRRQRDQLEHQHAHDHLERVLRQPVAERGDEHDADHDQADQRGQDREAGQHRRPRPARCAAPGGASSRARRSRATAPCRAAARPGERCPTSRPRGGARRRPVRPAWQGCSGIGWRGMRTVTGGARLAPCADRGTGARPAGLGARARCATACAPPRNRRSMFGSASSSSARLCSTSRPDSSAIASSAIFSALFTFCSTISTVVPCVGQLAQQAEHVLHHQRRQADRRLVDQQHLGPQQQRAADLELLLLAARQRRGRAVQALLDAREQRPAPRGCARAWSSCPA